MEKIVEQGLLYDFYGPLLTSHQQHIYEQVVYENLSLNEIADLEGISKQAVHDLMKRCTQALQSYEDKLHAIRTFQRIQESADALINAAKQAEKTESKEEQAAFSRTVLEIAEEIKKEIT